MGRDSRSRSRGRDRQHRRGRERRRDSRTRTAPQQKSAPVSSLPGSWHPSSSHFDTNKEYGLTLPREVESTQWSRKSQIAGTPVDEIRLVDVIPKGIQNYGVRLLANGRFVAYEMFRSRTEALVASELMKELYKQRDSVDLNKVLSQFIASGEDINEWSTKQNAVSQLCTNLVAHLQTLMPQDKSQTLLEEVEKLRQENAALQAKAQQQHPAAQEQTQPQPAQPPQGQTQQPPTQQVAQSGIPSFFPPASSPSPPPVPASSPFEQYRRPAEKPEVFGTHPPEGYGKAKIDAWIKKFVPKGKQVEVERLSATLLNEYKTLEIGNRPNMEAILTDWGLTSQILSKASMENQIKLLAAAQYVKN